MKSKAQFVDRWRIHVAGLALYGLVIDTTQGPMIRAGHAIKIPQVVEDLLARMYDDLQEQQCRPA